MKFKFLILSSLVFLLFSCKTSLKTTRPDEAYLASQLQPKPSTVALTIDLDIPTLEKSINNSLRGSIYEDNKFEGDNLMVKVTKTADLKFAVNGNVINCNLPLKVWVRTGYKKELLGLTAEDYYEANGAMTVNVSIAFALDKTWNLQTDTKINGYQWTEKPVVTAAGVNMPVTFLADITLKSLKGKIANSIDKTIAEKANLRQTMDKTWAEMQDPMQLNKEHDVWLKIRPIDLCTTPIQGTGKNMRIDLALNSVIETSVGGKPATVAKSKLPEYKSVSCVRPDFSIRTNVRVSYDKLTEIGKTMLVGKEFTQGSKKVRIDSLKFFGQNDYLVVQVGVSGSANGVIYCMGKPVYDNNTHTLTIKDFDFELKTRNVLMKSASWLLKREFIKMIEPMLNIPLKEQVNTLISTGNSSLKNYPVTKGVTLNGNLKNVQLDNIIITNDAILVDGELNGVLKVAVGDMF